MPIKNLIQQAKNNLDIENISNLDAETISQIKNNTFKDMTKDIAKDLIKSINNPAEKLDSVKKLKYKIINLIDKEEIIKEFDETITTLQKEVEVLQRFLDQKRTKDIYQKNKDIIDESNYEVKRNKEYFEAEISSLQRQLYDIIDATSEDLVMDKEFLRERMKRILDNARNYAKVVNRMIL